MSKQYHKENKQASDQLEIITDERAVIYKDLKEAGQDLKKLPQTGLVLDLHGVVDLFEYEEVLSSKPITVVSFVGRSSKTRDIARKEIQDRIKAGQIANGVLVFIRPKADKGEAVRPRHLGTKAWVIGYIANDHCLFCDDSLDHIELVNISNLPNVKAKLITGGKKQVLNTIKDH